MIAIKRLILYSLVGIEMSVIAYCSVYNEHGILAIVRLRKENSILMQEIDVIKQETFAVQSEISDWNSYPFYKEQYARDHLQMGRDQEEVYLL